PRVVPPAIVESRYDDVLFENLAGSLSTHHTKLVRVVGVCQIQFEGNVLWLSDQAKADGRLDEAIWLDVGWPPTPEVQALNGQRVVVEAQFDAIHGDTWVAVEER